MLLAPWWIRSGYLISEAVTGVTGCPLKTQGIKPSAPVERTHQVWGFAKCYSTVL